MNDDELEEARQKKLEEYKRKNASKEAEEQLKVALRTAMDENAYERLSNVAFANKELYSIAAQQILMLYKRAGRKITEEELRYVLGLIKERTEKKTSITFMQK
jgi:DNA-binding TFAR19-related protein (PDSD5 family)